MVPTPNRVDSVEVHNTGSQAVKVTAVYDNHKDGTDIQESAEIAPGGTHHFAEKLLDMGSWQAVAPIKAVSSGAQNLALHVTGIVKKLVVHVGENGALKQH